MVKRYGEAFIMKFAALMYFLLKLPYAYRSLLLLQVSVRNHSGKDIRKLY